MKKIAQKLLFILFFFVITAFSNCRTCRENVAEPVMYLDMRRTPTSPVFKKIYAVNANRVSFEPSQPLLTDTIIRLPFDFNQKTTKYILESASRIDSLTFSYDLEINHTKNCGYYYNLKNLRFVEGKSSFNASQIVVPQEQNSNNSGFYGAKLTY